MPMMHSQTHHLTQPSHPPIHSFLLLKIIIISIIITHHICKLNGLLSFPMNCFKKCLFDSIDTNKIKEQQGVEYKKW